VLPHAHPRDASCAGMGVDTPIKPDCALESPCKDHRRSTRRAAVVRCTALLRMAADYTEAKQLRLVLPRMASCGLHQQLFWCSAVIRLLKPFCCPLQRC
jgi:hypothetical protein